MAVQRELDLDITTPTFAPQVLDEVAATVGAVGNQLLQSVVSAYLSETPKIMDRINHATTAGHEQQCAALLHRLKGSSLSIGAFRLAQLCRAAEYHCASGMIAPEMLAIQAEYRQLERALQHYLHERGVVR